jgi:hypothetical protein
MHTASSPPGLGEERIPPGEAADIKAIADLSLAMLRTDVRPVPRGQHPKPHGVVWGEFAVEPGLPEALRHGLFHAPRTYACWIRFSSGSQEDDARGDIHGMAIKLLDVPGRKLLEGEQDETTQDFLLIDLPVMISRHARSNRSLAETMDRSMRPSLLKSLFFWQDARTQRSTYIALRHFVFGLRFHEMGCLSRAMSGKPASPLTTPYWSTTPYRLGPAAAVKYAVRPHPSPVPEPTDFDSKGRLHAALAAHLGQAEARFDFLVQVQSDPRRMPIEDASIEWDEAAAPFRKVATITIPAQVFDTEEQRRFGEDLSYTPWHSLPEHRPLGGINRARKAVYEAASRRRHDLNATPRREPTAAEGPVPATPAGLVGPTMPRSVPFHHVLAEELGRVSLRRRVVLAQERGEAVDDAARKPAPLGEAAERLRRATGQRPDADAPDPGPGDPAAGGRGPGDDALLAAARREALGMHLAGLAFSGGGIRSGSFAVGVLQGLASLGLLRRFDMLSTVSGGGYAGGWLAAWLQREGDPLNVERQLSVSRVEQATARRRWLAPGRVVDEEPEPLRHLRSYSSYMNPRPGLFTADTWAFLAIYARNILLNFLMLVPATLALAFLVRLVVWLIGFVLDTRHAVEPVVAGTADTPTLGAVALAAAAFVAGVALFVWAYRTNSRALAPLRDPTLLRDPDHPGRHGTDGRAVTRCVVSFLAASVLVSAAAPTLLPLLGASIGSLLRGWGDRLGGFASEFLAGAGASVRGAQFLSVPNVAFHAMLFGGLSWLVSLRAGRTYRGLRGDRERFRRAALAAGVVGGALLACAEGALESFFDAPHWFATLAPPVMMGVIIASIAVLVGVAGRSATEGEREWWGRLSGLLGLWSVGWAVVLGAIILLPAVLIGSSAWVQKALTGGYLIATIAGVLSGYSARTRGDNSGRGQAGSRLMERIAAVAPSLFLIGLLGGAGLLASRLVGDPWVSVEPPEGQTFAQAAAGYFQGFTHDAAQCCGPVSFGALLLWGLGLGLSAAFFSRYVDVNLFSLQAMYANRLTRCFLGASRPKLEWPGHWDPENPAGVPVPPRGAPTGAAPPPRDPNPITGFDLGDDLALHELAIGAVAVPEDGTGADPKVYWGPHLILNTKLNLVAGTELAWRDRQGESFSLTPLYCGSKSTGYAPLTAEAGRVLTLGRSVAISGAAVDPNMGVYQSGSMTALLTVFNARLGGWIENPTPPPGVGDAGPWRAESPKYAGLLIDELFGRTGTDKKFVHVSDGGHFENLGVYELIRRRCRYIVAVDAGTDPAASGENLANLIRLCRVDFGVRVQIDTTPLTYADGLSRGHVAIGRIRYDDVDNGQIPGILVYLKISLTGDEPPDLQQYAAAHPEFPHQSTIDQSYDEVQFECYRALGDHIARTVFEDAARRLGPPQVGGDGAAEANRCLFTGLRDRWADAPPVTPSAPVEATGPGEPGPSGVPGNSQVTTPSAAS